MPRYVVEKRNGRFRRKWQNDGDWSDRAMFYAELLSFGRGEDWARSMYRAYWGEDALARWSTMMPLRASEATERWVADQTAVA